MLRRTWPVPARMTETVSAPGLTTQTNLPSAEIDMGLEVVGPGKVAPCASAAPGTASATPAARAAARHGDIQAMRASLVTAGHAAVSGAGRARPPPQRARRPSMSSSVVPPLVVVAAAAAVIVAITVVVAVVGLGRRGRRLRGRGRRGSHDGSGGRRAPVEIE